MYSFERSSSPTFSTLVGVDGSFRRRGFFPYRILLGKSVTRLYVSAINHNHPLQHKAIVKHLVEPLEAGIRLYVYEWMLQ